MAREGQAAVLPPRTHGGRRGRRPGRTIYAIKHPQSKPTENSPMDAVTKEETTVFSLKAPVLSEGRMESILATTPLTSMVIKVYASGGENGMHAHANEDHCFVVLQGQATFHLGTEDNVRVVNKYEGVMLPRGAFYR